MKFEKPINENYCATVVKIKKIVPLEGCDNVVGTPVFGYQAIISKDHKEGDIGIIFPAETQLSDEYCYENNLYRHDDKNKTLGVKGYIEDNRRIKAVRFRGHRSDALFMPLESLKYLKIKIEDFNVGDEFDILNDHEICKKYVVQRRVGRQNHQAQAKKFSRVDTKHIPEHLDSDNYFKFSESVNPDTEVIVTQKLHGTSIRIANTIVKRKLGLRDHLGQLVGAKVQQYEHDYVFGSRKVIKDVNNPDQNHYYEVDIWTQEGKKLEGLLPQNYIVYGEVIGWTENMAAIQQGYSYQIPPGTCELYVYRVAIVNEDGIMTDLSWDHVKEFCFKTGLKHVPEMWRGKHKDFVVESYLDRRFNETWKNCLPLEGENTVDEGVCVRVDRLTPYILKAKSPKFLQYESKMLDQEVVDLEAEGSEV
jgi:hypothetical protein